MEKEVAHYVVTAYPPGSVLTTTKCNFMAPDSKDVLVAKSRCLEVRQLRGGSGDSGGGIMEEETTAATAAGNHNHNNMTENNVPSPFPVVLQLPIHGRIVCLLPFQVPSCPTSMVFLLTDRLRYAVLSYHPQHQHHAAAAVAARSTTSNQQQQQYSPYPTMTHASGSLMGQDQNVLGRPAESGPLVALDPTGTCIALHLYDGLLTVLPIHRQYYNAAAATATIAATATARPKGSLSSQQQQQSSTLQQQVLGTAFHCRIEERTVLAMTFLYPSSSTATTDNIATSTTNMNKMPHLCLLHQGSRGEQHLTSMRINIAKKQLHLPGSSSSSGGGGGGLTTTTTSWIQKSMVDGGSSMLIPVPPVMVSPSSAGAATASAAAAMDDEINVATRHVSNTTTASSTNTATGSGSESSAATAGGGVLIVGQQQITYCNAVSSKILPVRQALFLTYSELPCDPTTGMPRYLLGDEFGNLHMLTVVVVAATATGAGAVGASSSSLSQTNTKVVALQRETLGSCTLASRLEYLEAGLVFCASQLGDSQLVQIHDEPIPVVEAVSAAHVDVDVDTAASMDDDNNSAAAAAVADMMDTTYLSVVEEYTQLGPILDFDLIPTTLGSSTTTTTTTAEGGGGPMQCQVVTASGSSKSGSLRLIRNGIGMNEYAAVEIPGIQNMWSVRRSFAAPDDTYLVQSFVGETRVLGVSSGHEESMMDTGNDDEEEEEVGGTLEEVVLPGLDSAASTLHVGNIQEGDRLLQITESEVRLFAHETGQVLDVWSGQITVATANEAGQIAVSLQGGMLVYLEVSNDNIQEIAKRQMEREVSCINIHPLVPKNSTVAMDIDGASEKDRVAHKSSLLAVGLWDDFTVRMFELKDGLEESLCIHLSTEDDDDVEAPDDGAASRRNRNNMMARSLCLVTLDLSPTSSGAGSGSSSSGSTQGVDMLFVGLGDGTLISFAVLKNKGVLSVHSKKEVCLGTQRIDLVPLNTEGGGTCVLATGDRPTVIYLAGLGGTSSSQANPKLCYSNVNLAASDDEESDDVARLPAQRSIAVNVASPFFSPLLFDTSSFGNQHYSLCVADDANLRLGVIDDIQKLHVTTCRLGMAPRRIVHCPDGRFFAVGCLESGIKHFGLNEDEANMGNVIRFMDDTTFDDLEQINLEPFEMILSMAYVSLRVLTNASTETDSSNVAAAFEKPFLLVGTAYALANEDEPTRGRILVFTCQADESTTSSTNNRAVRKVTEFATNGAVYSICQFYDGLALCTVNTKTMICQLVQEAGMIRLEYVGRGHHGNILSLHVKSLARRKTLQQATPTMAETLAMDVTESSGPSTVTAAPSASSTDRDASKQDKHQQQLQQQEEKLAIVGDLMRSISLIEYYPEYKTLEEIARDFNGNWTTAIEMLHKNVYLGAENWNNLFCLRRNVAASSEEIRCRLDTIGEFHLGEMVNKFMSGSLVMPVSTNSSSSSSNGGSAGGKTDVTHRNSSSSSLAAARSPSPQRKRLSRPSSTGADASSPAPPGSASKLGAGGGSGGGAATRIRRPIVTTGSQTLFGTVDGTLGVILGLDGKTTVFFSCLERAMAKVIRPVGDLDHRLFRAVQADRRIHPAHGFVDGDLVESFLDLDSVCMEAIVQEMNRDGGWDVDDDNLLLNSSSAAAAAVAGSSATAAGTSSSRNDLSKEDDADSTHERSELTVDEVVAMVEEMTMLH